jgi:hypothetical protein
MTAVILNSYAPTISKSSQVVCHLVSSYLCFVVKVFSPTYPLQAARILRTHSVLHVYQWPCHSWLAHSLVLAFVLLSRLFSYEKHMAVIATPHCCLIDDGFTVTVHTTQPTKECSDLFKHSVAPYQKTISIYVLWLFQLTFA